MILVGKKKVKTTKECFEMLYCCMEGRPPDLVHRTIRDLWHFMQVVIWEEESLYFQDVSKINKFIKKHGGFNYDGENTLQRWIELYYLWCKEEGWASPLPSEEES